MKDRKVNVLHLTEFFLTKTMTFVYEIVNNRYVNNYVATCIHRNLDLFPMEQSRLYVMHKYFPYLFFIVEFSYKFMNRPFTWTGRQFDKIIHDNEIEVIFAHFGTQGTFATSIKRRNPDLRFVVIFYGYDVYQLQHDPKYLSRIRDMNLYVDEVIAITDHMKRELVEMGLDERKISVVNLGVQIPLEVSARSIGSEGVKLLHISGFTEKKGALDIAKALIDLDGRHIGNPITAHFVGDGPEKEECIRLSQQLKHISVTFDGYKTSEDLDLLLRNADIFIHPSKTAKNGDMEGVPTVIKQAMSYGLPCVSTFHSGIPELIINRKNGILVNENSPTEIAAGIIELMEDKELYSTLSHEASRTIAKSFSLQDELFSITNILEGTHER